MFVVVVKAVLAFDVRVLDEVPAVLEVRERAVEIEDVEG